MSGTIAIILIASVWLFVLAPWLLRGHRPISKAGGAFEETRVVYQGGEEELPQQRRPRVRKEDIHVHDEHEDYEVVLAEDTEDVLEDAPGATLGDLLRDAKDKFKKKRGADEAAEPIPAVVDGEVVHELPAAETTEDVEQEPEAQPVVDDYDYEDEASEYTYGDAYEGPADWMHPEAEDAEPVAADDYSEDPVDEVEELDQTDLEFAARRVGRGGWDPEAARAYRQQRLRRRQQCVAGFSAAAVITLVAAIFAGGWVWALFALAAALLAAYLVALRRQVLAEEALRRRRIRQLRRARMGVRNADDGALGVPDRLRHPGAVVLEIDDDSPDFGHLDTVQVETVEVDDLHARRAG
ncbi:gephyrin-like molybdotransferase receptor GlpR [Corynebacterium pelargi]|uniref:Uncharacterized protein n=1 Tax=Corynebacterium pelargi TaxID=1471400 RepID=A0A410W9Y4_9CORY|nr:gephyrin-like molybdotransferase receptor GlpR [Corynebacterium pelargi]QAU52768.1 hypothetical protein CPELA_07540 [Corynebacterium pelargi]GGG78644.1 hypothetical protein GCM10007338_15970 [Corynebacterium pelargi]